VVKIDKDNFCVAVPIDFSPKTVQATKSLLQKAHSFKHLRVKNSYFVVINENRFIPTNSRLATQKGPAGTIIRGATS